MKTLTVMEKKVASLIDQDITLSRSPFKYTARECGLAVNDILHIIKNLLQIGYIRRFGAILRHQKAGFINNAMVVWAVPTDHTEKAGRLIAAHQAVSHCYERDPAFQGKYNLFSMLHSQDNILPLVEKIAADVDIHDYLILESIEEYKKKSPEYF